MNEFKAILAVDEHVQGYGNPVLIEQWNVVKDVLHRQIWGLPPAEEGGGEIEWRKLAQQIPITEKGSEVLLFRMMQAAEAMVRVLEKELGWRECCRQCGGELDEDGDCSACMAAPAAASDVLRRQIHAMIGADAKNLANMIDDEFCQMAYCDECGAELTPAGVCLMCEQAGM